MFSSLLFISSSAIGFPRKLKVHHGFLQPYLFRGKLFCGASCDFFHSFLQKYEILVIFFHYMKLAINVWVLSIYLLLSIIPSSFYASLII